MPLIRRLIDTFVRFQPGEGRTALLMFAYSFLAMTSYNIIKPITRAKFIVVLGADNLPYVQLVAGVFIGLLMPLYSHVLGQVPRRWALAVTQAVQALMLVVFWVLFKTGADWVPVAFYVLALVMGILLISQFWTLANDIYDPRQARRLFGFIGGGASLGGAAGAALTALAVQTVGTDSLLLVSAAVLGGCVVIVIAIGARVQRQTGTVAVDPPGGAADVYGMFWRSRHLQVIALIIGFAAVGATIVEQQLNMAAESIQGSTSTDLIAGFLAQVTFYLSIVSFVVQIGLTSHIHRSLGLLFALLVLPMGMGLAASIILLNGALWAPAVARVIDGSLRHGLDKTTREVLFLPLPSDVRYRVKPFVDVTMDRLAKALGALLILVLIKPWGLGLDWQQLSYASLVVTGLWVALVPLARNEYVRALRRSLGTRAIEPAAIRLDVADATTVETLVGELSSSDTTDVVYAIDLLETLDKRHLITRLLLHHDSAVVRARVLRVIESERRPLDEQWTTAVERLLKDEDADVRATAVRVLASLRGEDASTLMRRYVDDVEPRVAVTAAVALAHTGSHVDAAIAEVTLQRLILDTGNAATDARREAAAGLARVQSARFRPLLATLMHDPDIDVAREAIRSAQATGPIDVLLVPGLVALLGHRMLKSEARAALVSYGDSAIEALAYFLTDRRENLWVRRHIPATLVRLPTQRSMDVLLDSLRDPDGFLRFKVVVALETLNREHSTLVLRYEIIEQRVFVESSQYYNYLTLRYNIVRQDPNTEQSLLVRTLGDKLSRTLDRIYRLLGLIYPWRDVTAVRYTLENATGRTRAGAVEFMDHLLGGAIRKRVMPILEDTPMAETVRQANRVLRSRPRDLEDTLAQLVHDDDSVVGSAAIQFIEQRQLWSLSHDLEWVVAHRSVTDPYVRESAAWVLGAQGSSHQRRQDLWSEPLPTVELAERLCAIALFDFASVDELFRIADMGRQVRYEAGHELCHEGGRAEEVQFLLEGGARRSAGDGAPEELEAPAVLGFEETLVGGPFRDTVRAVRPSICLVIGGAAFLTTLSDDILLTQGLFRMLLEAPKARRWRTAFVSSRVASAFLPTLPLQPIEKVMALRLNPLLGRANVHQLLNLAAVAQELPLVPGETLFSVTDPPAVYQVLTGEVRLDGDGVDPIVVGPGTIIGMSETLAGVPLGRSASVTREGNALRLDHADLFDVLSDHVDLLQGLLDGVLSASHDGKPSNPW
jgi:AAA family ATP:ADP antiporter